nr:hypothetical protein [Escherichia coli]
MKYILTVFVYFFLPDCKCLPLSHLHCPRRCNCEKNILTNEVIGKTPVEVDVSNTEAGSTFGISMYRHENVAIKNFSQ